MADDIVKGFKKVFDKLDDGVKRGANKALGKAITSTKNEILKNMREVTGLNNKTLNKRIRAYSPSMKRPQGNISIATKVGIHLSEFKPKIVPVKGGTAKRAPGSKGRPKNRIYEGVTVKVGKLPRQLVPGGFLREVKNGKELVLARKGQPRYPTTALRTKVFSETAESNRDKYNTTLRDKFLSEVDKEIQSAIDKKFK